MKNGKRNRTSRPRQHWLAIGMALLVGGHLGQVNAEESSIMTGATFDPTIALAYYSTSSGDVIINGSYKSFIGTASSSNPVDLAVTLSQKETLQTVALVAMSFSQDYVASIGQSVIVLVNDADQEVVSKFGVYGTGIYTLTTPAEAKSIIIRRVSEGNGDRLYLAHMRAYQSTNLMQYATVHYATAPVDSDHSAQNLIDNPESRSSSNLWNARTSASSSGWGEKAGYKSCYVVDQEAIAADGNQLKLVFDFQVTSFIHAVLLLDD